MLTPKSSESLSQLVRLIGLRIKTIHFILYEHHGRTDAGAAFLEISFADCTSLLLSPGADGASLKVERTNWCDPLENCVDDETQRFFEEHGKWKRTEVSFQEPYRHLVDREITGVIPAQQDGDFVGVSLLANGYRLTYSVAWAEGQITCEPVAQS